MNVAPKIVSMRVVNTSIESSAPWIGKLDAGAFRSPDPVPLHRQDFLGPLRQAFGRLQQIVGVVRDLEEPLLEIFLDHCVPQRQQAPSIDLLVREHGVVHRAPVHGRAPAIGQALLEHAREQPLVPAVVIRQARRQLASPRVADAEALQLPFMWAMLPSVDVSGWMPLLIAAFSAGRPNASQPNGCRTLKPCSRFRRATTSPMM
jgi:hypothetical protein